MSRVQIINKGRLVFNDSIEGLEQQMRASSVVIAVNAAPDLQVLGAIGSVQKIDALGDHRYRVFHDKDSNPAQQLAEVIVSSGWGLQELTPERRSMEQIFIDITRHTPTLEEDAA